MRKVIFSDPIVLAYHLHMGLGRTRSNGDRISDYHIIAQVDGQKEKTAVVMLTENTHYVSKPYYSVHLVDDITEADCELYYTENLEFESLVNLLKEIGGSLPKEIASDETPVPLAGDAGKVQRLEKMIAGECTSGEKHYGASLSYWRNSDAPIRIGKGGLIALRDYYRNHKDEEEY